ncbi:MAG: helix-turn-helix transcriptional regulator [Flavobacteriaceae bacterium]|jgi:transcriptional regulator with XRE-family HTH domain
MSYIFDVELYQMADRINRVKEVLVIQEKSQVWLAKQLGKSTTSVAAICNNKSQPHLKDLKKIAIILDVDIRELLVPTKD